MAVALIVAAGRGERLGLGQPKALVPVAGRPMLQWSVDALRGVGAVAQIVIALPAEALDQAPTGTVAVAGGQFRSQSVRAALQAAGPGDPVIVHDAARPLASAQLFQRALSELEHSGADAVIAARPVTETIKEAEDATVTRTVDRTRLWAVQTPQVFRRRALQEALDDAELLPQATDDAWLIEQRGGTVRVISSEEPNLKVTTPEDLKLAELLLGER
ncbi:MAG TPA: 2-C-methyl-D-erythritol 4-phosphate cytidylyltransferase [Solirubrobacteraceae bacterium]|nr:2-C-methyl-D-erythritol 4-phosphate cytidylyltransferase [Solirubrobacteraceae bacterium]